MSGTVSTAGLGGFYSRGEVRVFCVEKSGYELMGLVQLCKVVDKGMTGDRGIVHRWIFLRDIYKLIRSFFYFINLKVNSKFRNEVADSFWTACERIQFFVLRFGSFSVVNTREKKDRREGERKKESWL